MSKSQTRPHPLNAIINSIALVILLMGLVFALTQMSECEHKSRMGWIEEQRARKALEARP